MVIVTWPVFVPLTGVKESILIAPAAEETRNNDETHIKHTKWITTQRTIMKGTHMVGENRILMSRFYGIGYIY